jgi:hypothetical protein
LSIREFKNSPIHANKEDSQCSAKRYRFKQTAFIIGLALQHDGGPFGLSKKNHYHAGEAEDTTSAFLFPFAELSRGEDPPRWRQTYHAEREIIISIHESLKGYQK